MHTEAHDVGFGRMIKVVVAGFITFEPEKYEILFTRCFWKNHELLVF